MDVDGFIIKNGEYIIPYVDVKNDTETLQKYIDNAWYHSLTTGEQIERIIIIDKGEN